MRSLKTLCLSLVALMTITTPSAQAGPPVFGGGATAYDTQVGVINSGTLQDVSATVSPDRKYVTLGAQPQSSNVTALREFRFQQGAAGAGFVGGVSFAPNAPASGEFGAVNKPVQDGAGSGLVLNQRGMTRIVAYVPAK